MTQIGGFLMERFRLVTGFFGRIYAIPADKRGAFERWLDFVNDSSEGDCSEMTCCGTVGDFEKYRLRDISRYTFTDLQEDK